MSESHKSRKEPLKLAEPQKGLSIKDVRSQEGVFVQCRHFVGKGDFFSALFGAKNFEFFEIF